MTNHITLTSQANHNVPSPTLLNQFLDMASSDIIEDEESSLFVLDEQDEMFVKPRPLQLGPPQPRQFYPQEFSDCTTSRDLSSPNPLPTQQRNFRNNLITALLSSFLSPHHALFQQYQNGNPLAILTTTSTTATTTPTTKFNWDGPDFNPAGPYFHQQNFYTSDYATPIPMDILKTHVEMYQTLSSTAHPTETQTISGHPEGDLFSKKYHYKFIKSIINILHPPDASSPPKYPKYQSIPMSFILAMLYDFATLSSTLTTLVDYNLVDFDINKALQTNNNLQPIVTFKNINPMLAKYNIFSVPKSPVGIRLVILGDTHGQYQDVMNVFNTIGEPSPTLHYLFNGDIVDRGPQSLELITTIMLFKLWCPTCVHITRGNHEERRTAQRYGFAAEVRRKLPLFHNDLPMSTSQHNSTEILFKAYWDLVGHVFQALPLAYLLGPNKPILTTTRQYHTPWRIFVYHGGLPVCGRDPYQVSLNLFNHLNRFCDSSSNNFNDFLTDLLWGDPDVHNPGRRESPRGASCLFGAEFTKHFTQTNFLSFLIRSHEVVQSGFKMNHNNYMMTLFSAPRYGGRETNDGGYVILDQNYVMAVTSFDQDLPLGTL